MAKVRVQVLGTVGKSIQIDDTIPSRVSAVEESLRALIAQRSTQKHSSLQGLQVGNDHPQYPLKQGKETISGQWNFTKALWVSDGTAAAPAVAPNSDQDSGWYRIGANNLGLSMGGTKRWDINTTRVSQTVFLELHRQSFQTWANQSFFDDSGSAGPPCRISADDRGSFHFVSNADYAGSGNLFTQDNTAKPSFMFSMNQQFGEFVWHYAPSGSIGAGAINWNSASPIMHLTPAGRLQVSGAGSVALPALALNGTATGMSVVTSKLRFSLAGAEILNADGTSVEAAGVFRSANGSVSAPSFGWWSTNNTNSGMYLAGTDQIGWSIDGTNVWTLTSTALTATVLFQGPSGSAGSPTYSTSGDPNTGNYNVGADTWGTSTGGTLRWSISTTAVTSTLPIGGPDGSTGTVTFGFSGDAGNGMFLAAADSPAFASGGTERWRFNASGAIGLSGANFGTLGQVLTTNGSGGPPTWEDPSGGGGSSLAYVNTSVPAGNTIANTAAETAFASTYDIPANTLLVGSVIRIALRGVYSTDAALAPTLRVRLKLDAATVIDTTALTTVVSTSNQGWSCDALLTVTAVGASGAVESQGEAQFSTLIGAGLVTNPANTATIAVDTTQALTVSATATWGTADTDNTITLREAAIWVDAAVSTTSAAPADATYLTEDVETARLPNSRQLIAGSGITFDDSVSGERTIESSGADSKAPDAPPASPNAMDDEFDAGSLDAKWSWRNQGTSTTAFQPGILRLLPQSNASAVNTRVIEQAVPVGTWKFRAKVAGTILNASAYYGMCITASGTGRQVLLIAQNSAIGQYRMTSVTAFSAVTASNFSATRDGGLIQWRYFEIEYDGTNIITRHSSTGLDGTFIQVASDPTASFLGTPTHIGLFAHPASTTDFNELVADWFRRIS